MKAIVLAGGYATRLRPITYALPKLLFPVLGKPMIFWTLDLLKKAGVTEVTLAVNYLADLLRSEVGSKHDGIEIKYSFEKTPLGTAGPMKLASEATRFDETFLAMNGDIIAELDLEEMLRQHKETRALVTDALYHVKDPSRFGVAELDSEGLIRRFVEKPTARQAHGNLVNAGIYAVEPQVLNMIPSNRKVSLEREIFPILVKDQKLAGFPFTGDWFDIGNFSDYRRANFSLLAKRQFRNKQIEHPNNAHVRSPVLLGQDSRIEKGATAGPRLIAGKKTVLGIRSRVSHSILFDNVAIGEGSRVTGAILGSGVSLGRKVKIDAGTVVAPDVQIKDGIKVGRGVIIHPHKEIESNIKSGTHVM